MPTRKNPTQPDDAALEEAVRDAEANPEITTDPANPDDDELRVKSIMAETGCSFFAAATILSQEKQLASPIVVEPKEPKGPPRLDPKADYDGQGETGPDFHLGVVEALHRLGYCVTWLQPRHREWLATMAAYEGALRKMGPGAYSPEQFCELVIREAYASDPTKGGKVLSSATGRTIDFNPQAAAWDA